MNKVLEPNQAVPIPSQFVSLCVVPCPCPCLRSCRRVRSGRRVEGRCGDIAPVRGKCEPFITGWSKRTTAHKSHVPPVGQTAPWAPQKALCIAQFGEFVPFGCPKLTYMLEKGGERPVGVGGGCGSFNRACAPSSHTVLHERSNCGEGQGVEGCSTVVL